MIVFHDENGNGVLDHSKITSLPSEPMGFSQGFKFTLFSGMPNFRKLRFALGVGAQPVEISVK